MASSIGLWLMYAANKPMIDQVGVHRIVRRRVGDRGGPVNKIAGNFDKVVEHWCADQLDFTGLSHAPASDPIATCW
jgi:hypothetical protein